MLIFEGASNRTSSWHVGEPMNIPEARVLKIQVDGHELTWLLELFETIAQLPKDSDDEMSIYRTPFDPLEVNYPADR